MAMITKHHFEYNGRKYFRGNAHTVELLAYGKKYDKIGKDAYLQVQNRVKREYLNSRRIKHLGTVSVDWDRENKADVEAMGSINIFKIKGQRAVNGGLHDLNEGNCKLVGFAIDEGPLTSLLNSDAKGARSYLAHEGGDGRIVSLIWIVVEGQLSKHFSALAEYTVSANVAGVGLDITAKIGTDNEETITLGKGVSFAYLLYKVTKWRDNTKTFIEEVEPDYKSYVGGIF